MRGWRGRYFKINFHVVRRTKECSVEGRENILRNIYTHTAMKEEGSLGR